MFGKEPLGVEGSASSSGEPEDAGSHSTDMVQCVERTVVKRNSGIEHPPVTWLIALS